MRRVVAFWEDVDVLLTPTLAMLPVPIGWTYEETDGDPHLAFARQTLFTPFTPLVNVTGQPAAVACRSTGATRACRSASS